MIVRVSIINESYEILLHDGKFEKAEIGKSKAASDVSDAYWCLAAAVYLAWSFL